MVNSTDISSIMTATARKNRNATINKASKTVNTSNINRMERSPTRVTMSTGNYKKKNYAEYSDHPKKNKTTIANIHQVLEVLSERNLVVCR
jgi:hypothetical protein